MIQPLESSLETLDEYVEELAELVNGAREGEISQLLFRVTNFAGKDSDWTPTDEIITEIKNLFGLLLGRMAIQERFHVNVTHIRRATFTIEVTVEVVGTKLKPQTKKPGGDHIRPA